MKGSSNPHRKRASQAEGIRVRGRSLPRRRHPASPAQSVDLQHLGHLLDQSSDLILAFDASSLRIAVANDTASAWLGRERESLPGAPLAAIHPLLGDAARAAAANPGCSIPTRAMLLSDDGAERTVDGWARVSAVHGKLIGTLVARDVSDRIRVEESLRDSALQYRRLHEWMRDGFAQVDMEGRLQEFNSAYQSLLGYSQEELRQLTYEDLTPEEWHPIEAAIVRLQVFERGYSEVYEKEYRRKGGTVVPVELRTYLIRDASGSPTGMWAIVRDISDRKRAAQQLLESERKYRELVENANSIILRWNRRGEILFVNEFGLRFFGYRQDELVGQHVIGTLVPPGESTGRDLRPLMEAVCLHPEQFERNVNENMCRNGERVWIAWTNRAILDERREVVEVFSVGSDISDRKRAEEELGRQRSLFRNLFEGAPVAIAILDHDGRILELNRSFETLFGYPESEATGRDINELLPGETDPSADGDVSLMACSAGRVVEMEAVRHSRDGRRLDVHLVRYPNIVQGRLVGVFAIYRDITDRKRAEAALRASRNLLQAVLDTIPTRVFWKDRDLRYLGCNQAFARDAGARSPDEIIGLDDYRLGWRAQADLYRQDDRRVLESGEPKLDYEEPQTTPEGNRVWLQTSKIPLRDPDGAIVGILGTYQDITARKLAEEELARHRDQLEGRVAERTAELRQAMEQLLQAEKLAALGHLVAGMAHELNTPLGNARTVASALGVDVRSFAAAVDAGALRRSQVDTFLTRSREAVELLERNAARAADLIASFKQVAVDQASVRRRRFPLRQTVAEWLVTLQPLLKHTAHRVELDIPADLDMDSYPGPLEQVLTNLIGNSVLHGFAGIDAGVICIRAARRDPDRVQLDYADDGVGIPAPILHRVFEPFFTTQLGKGGSGLGLYIVYNLVTGVLGGTIQGFSDAGKGVRFALTLPRTAPDRSTD